MVNTSMTFALPRAMKRKLDNYAAEESLRKGRRITNGEVIRMSIKAILDGKVSIERKEKRK